jgi:transcriptional regulator with XRE-family HTH domain
MRMAKIDIEKLKGSLAKRQGQIAEAAGWRLNTLSRKLNGHLRLSLDDLNKICRATRREPAEFIIFMEDEAEIREVA